MSKDVPIAIAVGLISAFFALAYMTGKPTALAFSFISSLPLYIAGLMYGIGGAFIAGSIGFIAIGIIEGVVPGLVYVLHGALPVVFVTWLALQNQVSPDQKTIWYPGGYIISWLAVFYAGLFLVWAISASGDGVYETLRTFIDTSIAFLYSAWPEETRIIFAGDLAKFFPAMVAFVWMSMSIANGVIAQKMLVRIERNQRPIGTLCVLELPNWINWLLIGAMVIAAIGSGDLELIGNNLTLILIVPFLFLGLAVVHALARKTQHQGLILTAFYVFTFLLGWPLILVAGLGIIEQWFGLRKRFADPLDWEFD